MNAQLRQVEEDLRLLVNRKREVEDTPLLF
jgi:hypothetical protein